MRLCCRQFRLLKRNSYIGQFSYVVGGEGMEQREWMEDIVILARHNFHFLKKDHENLM